MEKCEGGFNKFLLAAGASREVQFNDFYTIMVRISPKGLTMVIPEQIKLEDLDGFTTRNGLTAVGHAGKISMYGGQDSEKGEQFEDLFVFDNADKTLK